jgi:hypothetical protein
MQSPLHFPICPTGALCDEVLALGVSSLEQLANYVRSLAYGRTSNPSEPRTVLAEKRGTCSSKHQLLAAVAHECGHFEVQLTVGIYEMSEQNTPGVGVVLDAASFTSIPEAHCYLTVNGERFDLTGLTAGKSSPFDSLLSEHKVSPQALLKVKASLHMDAMAIWASARGIPTAKAWAIREDCIAALVMAAAAPTNPNP